MIDTTLRYAFEHVVANALLVVVCLIFIPLDNPVLWVLLIVGVVGSLAVQHFRVKRFRQRREVV